MQSVVFIFAMWLNLAHAGGSKRTTLVPLVSFHSQYVATERILEAPEPQGYKAPLKYHDLLGNLYAGQTEFPWIVDVTVPFLTHLDAVGNLLTSFHVLVTCRTIVNYEKYLPSSKDLEEGRLYSYYEGVVSIRIKFASMYLSEIERSDIVSRVPVSERRMVGTLIPAWVQKHPDCNKGRNYSSDFAIIGLSRPLPLLPPFIALAPIWHDAYTASIPDEYDWVTLTTTSICWVAAWGRNYTNVKNAMTWGHKVKIRAYAYRDLSKCLDIWHLLCSGDAELCKDNTPQKKHSGLVCMHTRSGVGGVCDTNRGAPIVCEQQIYGLVTRGVPKEYCNSTDPRPFVVVNMHRLERGKPPLYSGPLVTKNREGAAPHVNADNIILYTRSGCHENTIGISVLVAFLLLQRPF